MIKISRNIFILLTIIGTMHSCGNELTIPKPPTYLKLDLPDHEYVNYQEANCNYSFNISKIYTVKNFFDFWENWKKKNESK